MDTTDEKKKKEGGHPCMYNPLPLFLFVNDSPRFLIGRVISAWLKCGYNLL